MLPPAVAPFGVLILVFFHGRAEVVTRSGTTIGDLTGTVTVALTNDVVVAGLPGYVIGSPLRETPQGTNRVHLSIYTPHQLESLSIDGTPVDAELQRELGFNRYLVFAEVAPGATVTVTFGLSGTVELSDGYRLTVAPQAVANPDQLVVDVGVDDQRLESSLVIVEDTVFSLDDVRPADP